jgi:hypothetical protein
MNAANRSASSGSASTSSDSITPDEIEEIVRRHVDGGGGEERLDLLKGLVLSILVSSSIRNRQEETERQEEAQRQAEIERQAEAERLRRKRASEDAKILADLDSLIEQEDADHSV